MLQLWWWLTQPVGDLLKRTAGHGDEHRPPAGYFAAAEGHP